MARFGIYYLRRLELKSVRIAGRRVRLHLPPSERSVLEYELGRLLFEDCYHLTDVAGPVRTVLDVGANVGLFALTARHHFPSAMIHCYEPNMALAPYLATHCDAVGAQVFLAGVGAREGRLNLRGGVNSLHTVSDETSDGTVPQVSFAHAVARLGHVDLLKLDCEGAEWSIFSDPAPWADVRAFTMEFHLWARPGSTIGDLRRQLDALGFSKLTIEPAPEGTFGFARGERPSVLRLAAAASGGHQPPRL